MTMSLRCEAPATASTDFMGMTSYAAMMGTTSSCRVVATTLCTRVWVGMWCLVAGSGRDELYGWTSDDVLEATRDNSSEDYLEGGPGHDTCHVRVEHTTVQCEDIVVLLTSVRP